jgi:hypothetical protein
VGGASISVVDANDPTKVYLITTADELGYFDIATNALPHGVYVIRIYASLEPFGGTYTQPFVISDNAETVIIS